MPTVSRKKGGGGGGVELNLCVVRIVVKRETKNVEVLEEAWKQEINTEGR